MANGERKPVRPVSSWALNAIALLGIFYTLYFARDVLLPVVLAMLFALLLAPLVAWLRRWGVPRPLGAFVLVFSLGGIVVLGIGLLAQPVAQWAQKAPQMINELQWKLYDITSKIEEVSEAAKEVEKMTGPEDADSTREVVKVQGVSLRDRVLEQTQAFLLGMFVVFFLLYFLLAGADRMWRNSLRALPTYSSRRRLVRVTRRMQREISRYLLTVTAINIGLGALTAALTAAFGLPNPLLWGVMVAALNYIPYLGPAVALVVLAVVSLLSVPATGLALLVPLLFLLLSTLEGQVITPTAVGRSLALNPVFVFIGLFFWGWLWGVIGVLLAVPIMASIKILCDHIQPWRPIGVMLGR